MTEASAADLSAIDCFRAALMADGAAQAMLCAEMDSTIFRDLARDWAEAHGIAVAPDRLDVAHKDTAAIGRFGEAPQSGACWPSRPWMPARVATETLAIDWFNFGDVTFDRPFFADSVRVAACLPFNRLMRYRIELLDFIAAAEDCGIAPDGLIFHMSRCGSTLVAQMLAADRDNLVLSEPEPLDTIVQLPLLADGIDPETHLRALKAMVAALTRNRVEGGRCYLKLDSWHMLALPLFRAAFPDTPWIYLYRDPVEVLVSQARMRGQQTAPGTLTPHLFGFAPGEETLPDIDYVARVLARTNEAVLQGWALGGGMLVNYSELPGALFTRILPHFGADPDAETRAAMQAMAARDAKKPGSAFHADSGRKQSEASDTVRHATDRYLAKAHVRLEALRLS